MMGMDCKRTVEAHAASAAHRRHAAQSATHARTEAKAFATYVRTHNAIIERKGL